MWFSSALVFILLALIHSGEADSSIQYSTTTDVYGSVSVTFDFGSRLEQAEAFSLTIRKDFMREPLLLCHWIITDRTGQENACQAKEGYTSPGIQGHRLTLTIPKASGKDGGDYIFCMHIDFEEEPTCKTYTVAVVEVNKGEADSSIQCSTATDVHGSANITFDLGSRLEQAEAYRPTLTIRKDFKREHLLLCHGITTDHTGQENACHTKEGYTSPGIQGHRLTLTILNASWKDSGHYTLCMHTDFEEEPTCKTCTVAVVEVNKGEADSSIQCSTATDVHGSANITFNLGNRLEQAETYIVIVRKDFKREPLLLCRGITTDRTGQENACQAREGYTSPGIQGHRLTLTMLSASWKDSGHYSFCMHTDFKEEPTVCKTYTVAVVEVNKDTASYTSITSSAIATAEPNMVVISIIIVVVVLTVVLVH